MHFLKIRHYTCFVNKTRYKSASSHLSLLIGKSLHVIDWKDMVMNVTAETMKLKFNQEEIIKAEEEYKKLRLDPAQQELVNSISVITKEQLSLPETVIKNFTWKVMSNWQKMRRITIAELENRPLRDRVDAAKEIIKKAKEFYFQLLSEATPEQKELLERKFDSILKQSSELLKNN